MPEQEPEASEPSVSEAVVDIVVRAVSGQLKYAAAKRGIPQRIMDPFAVGYLMGYVWQIADAHGIPGPTRGIPINPGEDVFSASCIRLFGRVLGDTVYNKRPFQHSGGEELGQGWDFGAYDALVQLGVEDGAQTALAEYVYEKGPWSPEI